MWAVPSACDAVYFGTTEANFTHKHNTVSLVAEHAKPFHFWFYRWTRNEPTGTGWELSTYDLRKSATVKAAGVPSQYVESLNDDQGRVHSHSALLMKGAYTLHFLQNAEQAEIFVPNANSLLEVGGGILIPARKDPRDDPYDDRAVPIRIGGLIEGLDEFFGFLSRSAEPGTLQQANEHNAAVLEMYYQKAVEQEHYATPHMVADLQIVDPPLDIVFLFDPNTGKIGAFKNQLYAERASHLAVGHIVVQGAYPYVARVDAGPAPMSAVARYALERLPILIARLRSRQSRLKP